MKLGLGISLKNRFNLPAKLWPPKVEESSTIDGDPTPSTILTGVPAVFTGAESVSYVWLKNGTETANTTLEFSDTENGDEIIFRTIGTNAAGSTISDSDPLVIGD